MKIDIVFISFNRKSEIQVNLNKMSGYNLLNKIIWIDNGSIDNITSIIYNPVKVNLIRLEENIGIKAYNIGAAISDADVLILLDDDSHVDESAVEAIAHEFETNKKLGALALKIILPTTGEEVTKGWKDGPATYFWGCGAAIRKLVWDKLGGYREELFLYTNEYDLCIRVWNEGFEVLYTSKICAYHRVSSMNRTSGRLVFYSIRNNYIFIKTYFDIKYHLRLFFYDRLTWFIRALLTGAIYSFFKGVRACKESNLNICRYYIEPDIQKFYINNQRIFESPLKKIIRKYKAGLLFKIPKGV